MNDGLAREPRNVSASTHRRRSRRGWGALLGLSLSLAPLGARAQDAPPFALGANSFVRGIFLDGDALAIGGSSAAVVWRDGTSVGLRSSGGSRALCGRRVGDRLVVGHAGFGGVARSDGVNVAEGHAPVLGSEQLSSCAVDATGAVYFVGERRAAYRWSGNTWEVLEYGSAAAGETFAAAFGPDGALYVASASGLLRLAGERFEAVPVAALAGRSVYASALWVSERTGRVYIGWGNDVVVFDPQTGGSTAHAHGMFGAASAITGVASPAGDLVAVAAQSAISLFDGRRFSPVPREFVFTRGLAFDPRGGTLYVGAQSEVGAVAVAHPWLAAAAGSQPPPVARPAPEPTSSAPIEQRTDRVEVTPAGGAPSSSGQGGAQGSGASASFGPRRYSYFPVVRFGFGAALGRGAVSPTETGFAFDLTAGFLAHQDRRSVQFMPEIGVSYQAGPTPGGTYFTTGLSALYGTQLFSGGLGARGMLGGSSAGLAAGVRSGLVLQALFTSFTLDVGYQFLPTATDNRHAFVATLSVNPVPLIAGLFFFSSIFGRLR